LGLRNIIGSGSQIYRPIAGRSAKKPDKVVKIIKKMRITEAGSYVKEFSGERGENVGFGGSIYGKMGKIGKIGRSKLAKYGGNFLKKRKKT